MGLVKEGSGSERQKYRSESAKIFSQRAENQSAENTKALKNYSPVSSALLATQIKSNGESRSFFWCYRHFGALVIFQRYCKNIILALLFWRSGPARERVSVPVSTNPGPDKDVENVLNKA